MQIDWWTLALQAINFLVLIWLLWRFLYRPVREVIEKRKQLAEQAFADAKSRENEAEAARRHLEESQAGLARERQAMLRQAQEDIEAERRKAAEDAKGKAAELLENARAAIAEEREDAVKEIRQQAAALAVELASDLLRNTDPAAASGIFLEKIERYLNDMPEEERMRLQQDIAPEGARLTVVTAMSLPADERERWNDRLGACLGHNGKADFAADAELLGGAELRFPHAVLKFTWLDQLRKAEEILRKDEAAS